MYPFCRYGLREGRSHETTTKKVDMERVGPCALRSIKQIVICPQRCHTDGNSKDMLYCGWGYLYNFGYIKYPLGAHLFPLRPLIDKLTLRSPLTIFLLLTFRNLSLNP